jgi:hypothetical protein
MNEGGRDWKTEAPQSHPGDGLLAERKAIRGGRQPGGRQAGQAQLTHFLSFIFLLGGGVGWGGVGWGGVGGGGGAGQKQKHKRKGGNLWAGGLQAHIHYGQGGKLGEGAFTGALAPAEQRASRRTPPLPGPSCGAGLRVCMRDHWGSLGRLATAQVTSWSKTMDAVMEPSLAEAAAAPAAGGL